VVGRKRALTAPEASRCVVRPPEAYVISAVPWLLTSSLGWTAFRAISWEAEAGPAKPRMHPKAQR